MRSALTPVAAAVAAALVLVNLAGCVPETGGPAAHPNPIIVREFTFSLGVVTLDPSFGFSLRRGAPGVPPRQRAASLARAAAFNLADAIAQQLSSLGYDAIRSDTAAPEPGARALIVTGAFRQIDEGYRRLVGAEHASLAVDVAIDYQAAGAPAQRIMAFPLDSLRVPRDGTIGVSARRAADVDAAAARLGAAIAGAATNLARLNNWPAAPR